MQLRILVVLLGVTVMGEVQPLLIVSRIKQHEPAGSRYPGIYPTRLERGYVIAFVLTREQEINEDPLQHKERDHPCGVPGVINRHATHCDSADLAPELQQTPEIGSLVQHLQSTWVDDATYPDKVMHEIYR